MRSREAMGNRDPLKTNSHSTSAPFHYNCAIFSVFSLLFRLEATRSSETLENIYQTTRYHIPEDRNLEDGA
jgi:hypothetical protein